MLSEIESDDEEMIGLKRKKNSYVQTQTHEYTGHPIEDDEEEVTKPSTSAKSLAPTKPSAAIKSSVGVDKRKLALAVMPYTTVVVFELTEKEKRATHKKIKEEVLQKNPQFKAVLGVPQAFGMEHWKVLLSQMEKRMVVIISISCSLASPELVKAGGPKPL